MPRKQALTEPWRRAMREHFARAEFTLAGEIYDAAVSEGATTSYEDDLLRARILLKNDENRAVAFLIQRPPKGKASGHRAQWELFLGIGYARLRDFERADHHFAVTQRLVKSPGEKAELAYHTARRWMLEGRTDEAHRFAEEMSCEKTASARVAQEVLRSLILSQEEKYRDSAESLIKALGLIGKQRERHLEQWFHAVQNLALLARELSFEEAAVLARQEVDEDIEWPEDFRAQQFQARKAVGWCCALRGDMLGCFRYLRAAERAVPNEAFAAILLLDRSYFARIVGEKNWSLDEIAKAESIAQDVDWNALPGDERVGLLLLAAATSRIDPEKGRYYLARYRALDRVRSPLHWFAFDHRLEAMTAHAEGVVRLAAGDNAGAEQAFRNAWVIFDRIAYDWRAARTALRLFQVTQKHRWRHLAEDKIETFPRSWLARELGEGAKLSKQPIKLPPMQRKVFEMLCQKMSTAEIATSLGLSQHTIRNHLKAVFRAFGVNSRAALVAEAAARGELPFAG